MNRVALACALTAWVLTATIGVGQASLTPITFLTNYVFIGRHAPFFVGLEKGYYRDAGFDLSIVPATGSAFVISALEGGQADFGIAEASAVVQAVGRGAGVKAFGVFMDETTSGLASMTPYPTPRAIVGKTVAASLTDSVRVTLPILFSQHRLDLSGLQWLAADPSIYFALLLAGRADLVTASVDSDVPALRRVAEPRGRTVYFASFAEWGYDIYGYFLLARAQRIASNPDQVRAFGAATARAVRDAVDDPEGAAEILVRHVPVLTQDTALRQWRASLPAIDTPSVREHGYGVASEERLQRSIDFVQQAFELERALAPADLFADGFMPANQPNWR